MSKQPTSKSPKEYPTLKPVTVSSYHNPIHWLKNYWNIIFCQEKEYFSWVVCFLSPFQTLAPWRLRSDLWNPGPGSEVPHQLLKDRVSRPSEQGPGTRDSIFNMAPPSQNLILRCDLENALDLYSLYSIFHFTTKPKYFGRHLGKKSIWRGWKHKGRGRKETVSKAFVWPEKESL